jgi:hypothetical protein
MIFNRSNLTRDFHLFLILGHANLSPFWESEEWSFFLRELDSVLMLGKGQSRMYISCRQRDSGVELKEEKPWNGLRENLGDEAGRFGPCDATQIMKSLELWVPGKKECESKNRPPEFFMGIRNENALFRNPVFSPYIVVAVDANVSGRILAAANRFVENLATKVNAELRARTIRPWGIPFGRDAIVKSIGDLLVVDAFKVGKIHNQKPTLESLEGKWSTF